MAKDVIFPPPGWKPHSQGQVDIIKACFCKKYKYIWLSCGKRYGKSYLSAIILGELVFNRNPGKNILVVVPDFRMFRDVVLPYIKKVFPKGTYKYIASPDMEIRVYNGSNIYIRSASDIDSVESIEGIEVGAILLEEACLYKHTDVLLDIALARHSQPCKNPIVLVNSTPKGLNYITNWFGITEPHPKKAWTNGYSPKPGYYVRAAKTADNIHLREEYVNDQTERLTTDKIKEQLEGQIVLSSGRYFKEFERDRHVLPHKKVFKIFQDVQVINRFGGVDYGYVDSTACVVGGWKDETLYIIDEYKADQKTMEENLYNIKCFQTMYTIKSFYCDRNPEFIAKASKFLFGPGFHRIQNFNGVSKKKYKDKNFVEAGRAEIISLLSRKQIIISDKCEKLIQEIEDYLVDDRPGREGGIGEDHLLDALRYLVISTSPSLRRPLYYGF